MSVSLSHPDRFVRRHIGPSPHDRAKMLATLEVASIDALINETIPASIRTAKPLSVPPALSEWELLAEARRLAELNGRHRSFIGQGYYDTMTPPVILRNIVQNPGWYTQYTPYQAEIAQGRLEALLNFQTMVSDLTGLPVANASLLDEATAAAEAMHLAYEFKGGEKQNAFFVDSGCLASTLDVVRTRAKALGVDVIVGDFRTADLTRLASGVFGALVQYPTADGAIFDYRAFGEKVHAAGGLFVVAADLLALTLLSPPGEFGADVALGSSQRFGVPLGYGGPHAAFFSAREEFVRKLPGRIIGVSADAAGRPAFRMALQTREQHIRREKATSNICTAQALLAIVAGMYAVYHGPEGLKAIAERVHGMTTVLAEGLRARGRNVGDAPFFDTLVMHGAEAEIATCHARANAAHVNLRVIDKTRVGVSLDEATTVADIDTLLAVLGGDKPNAETATSLAARVTAEVPAGLKRSSTYLTHAVFHAHRSETEMLRYMRMLEGRDLSLAHSMIPLGSCTMKLNATAEMIPITEPGWNSVHPYAPREQIRGYEVVFRELEAALADATGFAAVSLQPNAGSQGEYAGLLAIRGYHESRGEGHRKVCLIPQSAHGTNPASAVMAGMQVVVVKTDASGNIDLADLETQATAHAKELAALMVTYPSTHGVFEEGIRRVCEIVHGKGGQVYMDGANMNAMVGLCRPGEIGADVCHINLHKTFCIPHGGGGPGMGPIAVAAHLAKFLPGHSVVPLEGRDVVGAVSQAPWGSASILLISWAYVRMMGAEGLTDATKMAIANANYIAKRLAPHYPIVYVGKEGRVAHECIFDVRGLKKTAGVEVDDIAKRLMDYGFHAPTMSFPIPGTLMVEPTESESLAELDRFCDAMIAIRQEIRHVEEGRWPKDQNPLKNAPHTLSAVTANEWTHPYSREEAAFPSAATRERKFWPHVARINNALGDRHLVCTCPPMEAYAR
ncbi:MAG: aminomethyl-transferring glycine dehydrogenase [Myxococcales bacterium]|nr:aminomethyl-transferring glycine dehydrogenase [Myxococcales bacterium]